MTRPTRQRIGFVLALLLGLGLVVYSQATEGATTPYSRGSALVAELGCLTCHSELSRAAMPNPSRDPLVADGVVPPLVDCQQSAQEFSEWVLKGAPDKLRKSERWQRTHAARLIEMPAYSDQLNAAQVEDLRAWSLISARAEARPPSDALDPWARAEALASELGCFSCHGELGQGGVPNPGSLTGQIPALVGDDFVHLTDGANPAAIMEWVAKGHSEQFLSGNPLGFLGRRFMRNQRTQMPAYEQVISEENLQLLVSYCLHLNALGPLNADTYGDYRASLRPQDGQPRVPVVEPQDGPLADPVPPGEALPEAVAVLLSDWCIHCHGPKKQKSEYRMDTREAAFADGDIASYLGVKNIVPGQPEASLLYTFITATEEDPENELFPMPPEEDERLTPEQIELVRDWIAIGAPWHTSQTLTSTHSD